MTDIREKIKSSILAGINYFIATSFIPNVYNYLFERDIQSHLFMILRESLIPYAAEKPIEIRNCACKKKGYSGLESFRLNYIYTEYSSRRIDIVCLDPEKTLDYEEYREKWGDKNYEPDPLWDQPPLVGIEIKYIRCGYRKDLSECKADRDKLREYAEKLKEKNITDRFEYLVLGFVQEHSSGTYDCHEPDLFEKKDSIKDFDYIYLINTDGVYKYLR